MSYMPMSNNVLAQAIADTSTTQLHKIGERVEAWDETYGVGVFIYLKGVASTAVGNLVVYDQYENSTTRAVAGSRGPAAVAMSANVADQYGWYQVAGAAVVTSGTVADNGNVYLTATPGSIDDAVVSGDMVNGARLKTANGTPSAGLAIVELAYPCANGLG